MNKKIFPLAFMVLTIAMLYSCETKTPTDLTKTCFIPKPVSVTATGDAFNNKAFASLYYQAENEKLQSVANYLAGSLSEILEIQPEVLSATKIPRKGIYLNAKADIDSIGNEGYVLTIEKKQIQISANSEAGCFYGVQTLLQMLPVPGDSVGTPQLATGIISDYPSYKYRGAMLDVSRHFFGVEDVKRFIDFLSMYKMNALHLHLSDDQGWRIEIKSWPLLTEIGGQTEVGGTEGGFFTQEDYSEIVNYALERHVTIIPEIDMPGHTNAALASYAELNCDGKARELYTGMRVGFSTLCTDKEITYQFVDDVIREISALTPGPYFHIGGDESHVTAHDDYVYFVNRVQDIVAKYDKKVIGWDEIANADLAEKATVQFWANVENTTLGLKKGAQVIMSPAAKAYLDMQYNENSLYGLHWAGYVEVDTAYQWNPVTLVPGITKDDILGIESPLWSETVTNIDEVEYMVFPRLPGYAEIGWTEQANRNWEEYKTRLAKHGKRFKALDINFYRSERVPWE